jgi:hypothetical protein
MAGSSAASAGRVSSRASGSVSSSDVHLHGYDISRRIRPGAPTLIVFRATVVGQFEVELEERHLQLAEIEVRP